MSFPAGYPDWICGPTFSVSWACDSFGPDARGMIVKHKASGLMCWTGTIMTPQEAAGRIVETLNQQSTQKDVQ